ncbi:DEAD/DEAH box helicase [Roseomonas stagni]|uniref:DEAD/DEAH box helicase n=1 Tax=Falsiroseomonas algicola TaxID=2716930 RepID=A0A6M1LS34_9PROT|nr:DEAD/DEAH box helicase [Falsiroseomonas algicola]NGM23226.1 DEAD/DEAH box helicase [Falsiroseomonas algicola]
MPPGPPATPADLIATLDDAALSHHFTRNALEAGRRYHAQGRVRDVTVSQGGTLIEARVRGSAPAPYRQRISLAPGPDGRPLIAATCDCPVTTFCKHAAAALVAARVMPRPVPVQVEKATSPPPAAPLDPALQQWIARLRDAAATDPEAYPDSIRQRLFYVLDQSAGAGGLSIECTTVSLLKNGSPGVPRRYAPHQVGNPAKYLRPSDRPILRRLNALQYQLGSPREEDDLPDLLRAIIATGRAHWAALDGPVLTAGPPLPGRLAWRMLEDGGQVAALEAPAGLVGLRLPAPWYADPATGRVGPVDLGVPALVATRLLAAPPIPPEAASAVGAELAQHLPGITPPAPVAAPELLPSPPVPRLLLTTATHPYGGLIPKHWRVPGLANSRQFLVARLTLAYGALVVPPRPNEAPRNVLLDGERCRLKRDAKAERAALARLGREGFMAAQHAGYGWGMPADDFVPRDTRDGADWMSFTLHRVPALRADGWQVDIAPDFPIRFAQPESDVEARLTEGSGIDWLELELGVVVDGERIDIVPTLLAVIAKAEGVTFADPGRDEETFLLPLPDGRLLTLPMGRIRPTLQALAEIMAGGGVDPEKPRLGFSKLDAADLAALEQRSGLAWSGGEALRGLGRQLREAGGAIPPATLPAAFQGALRPYQAEGVAWLQFLAGAGLGGVLADDMGLGKTVQTLAHLAIEQAAGRLDRPALIVCPTSLVPNWAAEAARFAPGLRLLPLHGPARKARFAAIAAHDLVLTAYPLLARDSEALGAQEWHAVILDEAQTIRNPNAETTRQARQLKARHRLALSGTPLQNHLGELWSIFDFLAPGFLGGPTEFRRRYRTPIEKHGDQARQVALQRRVRPFLLRRTKAEVVRDLPPKTEIVEHVELEPAQRAVYEGIRMAMHARVRQAIAEKGLARSGIIILDALLKLRQACCDPRLLKLDAARRGKPGSAKLDRLMDLLAVLLAEGRRVIVFSQFTSMLALIADRLRAEDIAFEELTGSTKDRAGPVGRFQAGQVPVFLISLKAGGVGLTLTAADTVIHYDPWWNPAAEDQATDRAHRIGQDKPVFVHRLVALATIEEKMEVLKSRKRALVAAVLEAEEGAALRLTEADVEELFAAG